MDWVWSRVSGDGWDWFIIRVRRSDRFPEDMRCSLTLIDHPHSGEETRDRSVFRDLDAVFEITGPLAVELRAEGWEKAAGPHVCFPATCGGLAATSAA